MLSISTTSFLPENRNITLTNAIVQFQYSRNSPLVLPNILLTIPQNKVTAIVGRSGSGKSTLLKLLVKFYKPTYGKIKMGNISPFIMNDKPVGGKHYSNQAFTVSFKNIFPIA